MQTTFTIQTAGPRLYPFTALAADFVAGQGEGLLTLFVRHTSCSLLVQENADPSARHDMEAFLARLVPRGDAPGMGWLSHVLEGPDDMPAHLRAMLLPVSLSVPVAGGRLRLGTWQGLYLVEHRDRPQRREIAAHFA